jgi:putative flippase GtrA
MKHSCLISLRASAYGGFDEGQIEREETVMAVRVLRKRETSTGASHLWRRVLQRANAAPTFARFAIAGTAGYLVYQAVLFLGQSASLPLLPSPGATAHLPLFLAPDARLLAASLVAAEASILVVFCIHSWWTFRERSATGSWWRRLAQFHVKSAVSTFGILTVGVNVLSGRFGLDPYMTATLGTLVAFIWNWLWDSRIIWGRPSAGVVPARASPGRLPPARPWARARSAAPYALAAILAVLAAGLWGYLVVRVIDGWDGDGADQREDIVAFYAAGSLVRDGRGGALYEPDAVTAREREILGRPAGLHNGLVYLNPPFVAGLFEPLAHLPYGRAQALWFALSALAVFASIALLLPELRRLPRRWALVFVLAALASFPVFWSLLYGQLSALVLLSWILFYRLLRSGRDAPAGLVLAASLVKPHLALVPVIYLLTTRRWRALAGYAAGAAILIGASVALVGPGVTFVSYPALILESLSWQVEYGVDRVHMYGWASFLAAVLPGASRPITLLLSGVASVLTLLAAVYVWRRYDRLDDGSGAALALATATILTSPHIHVQDLQILLLPAMLLVAYRRDVFAVAAPVLLFFLIPVAVLGVNIATPALAAALAIVAAKAAGVRVTMSVLPAAWWKSCERRVRVRWAATQPAWRRLSPRASAVGK